MKKEQMLTTYEVAVKWGNTNIVRMNNICEVDPMFVENNPELFEHEVDGNYPEYFQFFVTDMGKEDAEYKKRAFDLKIGYSELLDCYVLCVPHYGTQWSGVACQVNDKIWWTINKKQYAYDVLNK